MPRKLFFATLAVLVTAAAVPLHGQTCNASEATGSSAWVNNPGATPPTSVPGGEGNHCNFAQFSWQSFLSLMQPSGSKGQLSFETYMSADGLFVANGQQPLAWGQSPWPLTLGGITQQAGSSEDLVAQSGVEVQYDESVNEAMYDYINSNKLYNANCFNSGSSNIHMPPSTNPSSDPQSIELKTAWLPMSPCDSTKYHCVTALVNNQPETVALIGFHVVHKLPDHQEWIWSTFEHVNNSPDCAQISNPPTGYSSWNFFQTGFVQAGKACTACASEDGEGCDVTTECNVFTSDTAKPNICRTRQLTTLTCQNNGNLNDDDNDVVCLNQSVWSTLPSNSVWRNYMLVGTVWFKPGMTAPDTSGQVPPTGQAFIGNTLLSNTSAETYTQQANANCLSAGCHVSTFKAVSIPPVQGSGGHADFSHVFNRIQQSTSMTCPTLSTVASHGTADAKKATATAAAPTLKPASSHGQGYKQQN